MRHATHNFTDLPPDSYAYLLGQYLGDGSVCRVGTSLCLRIVSDAQYAGIISECSDAIAAIRGRPPNDIRQLFTYACDLVGVAWRPWGRYHNSVARKDAVALLDEFIGPKR